MEATEAPVEVYSHSWVTRSGRIKLENILKLNTLKKKRMPFAILNDLVAIRNSQSGEVDGTHDAFHIHLVLKLAEGFLS
jgi:hypothetical protein